MNARSWTPWIALAAVLALSPAHAATERVASPLGTTLIDTGRRLDINQINLLVRNDGTHGYDLVRGDAGLEYPRGSGKFALFAGGVWLSARVIAEGRNELRGALAQFGSEYGPGVMTGGTFTDPNDPDDRVYKVSGFTGNPMDTARVMRSPSELLADPNLDLIVHHSWSEYIGGAARYGAPVRTYRLPVTATPDPADSTDVQGPDFAGDQMLWCVYNDADPLRHAVPGGTTAPLGVEVQQTMSASTAIENTAAARIAHGEISTAHPRTFVMTNELPTPSMIPIIPPSMLKTIASIRNCRCTSSSVAPIAMRIPISRVRSVTDTSMMFMMPMPPTSSDTLAIEANR